MAFTGKQERNGAVGSGGEQNTAVPGPYDEGGIAGAMSASQSAADVRSNEASNLMRSPAGTGLAGHNVGGGGSMFEWDAGLAIHDVEGGISG